MDYAVLNLCPMRRNALRPTKILIIDVRCCGANRTHNFSNLLKKVYNAINTFAFAPPSTR